MSDANAVRRRQLWAVAAREAGRSLAGRRLVPLGVLAALPVVIALLRALMIPDSEAADLSGGVAEFAQVFWVFIVRVVVFFAAAHAFVKTFRAEITSETLHWSLLAPLRRRELVLGKFAGAWISTTLVLTASTALTWVLFLLPHAAQAQGLFGAVGLLQVVRYGFLLAVATAAYGAVFLLMGLYFRSPMIPAVVLLGWEALAPFLPATLKQLTVVHQLSALLPVPVRLGSFAVAAAAPPVWLALLSLAVCVGVFLTLAVRKARRLEVSYSAD
jgi:ABC-type transport system involved in multi-copper enzyme maturation permease subunit